MSMEMPKPQEMSKEARIAEVKRLLDMYHRDLANEAMGHGPALSHEDYMNTEAEIKRLEKELEELERGA